MMLPFVVLLWLAALGGTIGSFLNVVVYRLPAGKSLVYPGSHCPVCKHPIRWYDNVPVFGWLALGGRCRDCGVPIPKRYPLVEATTALVFLIVGAAALLSLGGNLPPRPVPVGDTTILLDWTTQRLAGIVAWHLLLLSTLLAAAFIEYDGNSIPWRLAWPAFAVGLIAPVAWPFLHPVPAWPTWPGLLAGVVDGIVGFVAGLVLGLCIGRTAAGHIGGIGLGPACVGLFLGWQAAVILAGSATLAYLATRGLGKFVPSCGRFPFHGWLALGSLAWIVCWRALVEWGSFFG
ncbi:MAG: prepilin peptidase [Rhodopirellula sp.]|nr:prepilin peptidase [Rhodopirellula sp.]